jgi:hypothetical protein
MRCQLWIGVCFAVLVTASGGLSAEPTGNQPPQEGFFKRFVPAGGWCPDTGGLLHWWNPDCFPRCSGPDDYCRKPLPRVCWPAPAYPPEIARPQGAGPRDSRSP